MRLHYRERVSKRDRRPSINDNLIPARNGIDLQCLHYSRAAILHQKKAAGSRNRRIDLRAQFGRASSRVLASRAADSPIFFGNRELAALWRRLNEREQLERAETDFCKARKRLLDSRPRCSSFSLLYVVFTVFLASEFFLGLKALAVVKRGKSEQHKGERNEALEFG